MIRAEIIINFKIMMLAFTNRLKQFDKFGETVNFTVSNDDTSYRTFTGSLISLLINGLILVYSIR